MYVCGPTVYDLAHIGNARPIIVFDVLFRLLRHIYGDKHVTYARNITDVDDKINARAVERYPDMPPTEAIRKLTEETTAQFHKDIAALGVLPPTVEPRATDHIAEMRDLCEALVRNGHAYVAEDHVLFAVNTMPDYGTLARRSLEEMEAGARVDVAPYKKGAMDFVLWKPSKPGEPAWPSPCGIAAPGRPGWHIECSAMAGKHLGNVFDIHGGGIDLVFPHHENEVAQSRCAHGTPVMANVWMHNGFLQVEGEKMSKSLGNFVTIKELLDSDAFGGKRWPGEVLRLSMLMTSYREPINFSVERLIEAKRELWTWIEAFKIQAPNRFNELHVAGCELRPAADVLKALKDDLNAPAAITAIRALCRAAWKGDGIAATSLGDTLVWLGLFRPPYYSAYDVGETVAYRDDRLPAEVDARHVPTSSDGRGLRPDLIRKYWPTVLEARTLVLNEYDFSSDAQERAKSLQAINRKANLLSPSMESDGVKIAIDEHCCVKLVPTNADAEFDEVTIQSLINARLAARKAKNWAESDRIRDELAAMGIQLKDGKDTATGDAITTWEVKR
jgi:cysteinyl-tRNA synthetase